MAHTISLNLSFLRILQGSLLHTILKSLSQFLFLLLIFFSICSQAHALTLSGTVYGGGNPLPNTAITLNDASSGSLIGTATTDASGIYSFLSLSDGIYNMTVVSPVGSGFGQSLVNGVFISGVDVIQNVVLLGQTTVELSGIVRDSNGIPASNITVAANDSSGGVGGGAITDAQGRYSILVSDGATFDILVMYDELPGGGVTNIQAPPYFYFQPAVDGLVVTGDTVQDIVIPSFVQLSGYTTDSNGVPVPNVHISSSADITVNGLNSRAQINTTSDENGWYSFVTIPHNDYGIHLIPPQGSNQLYTNVYGVDISATSTRDFVLESSVELSGIVRDSNGIPASNITVAANDSSGGVGGGAITDAQGRYSILVSDGATFDILVMYDELPGGGVTNIQAPPYFYFQPAVDGLVVTGDTVQDIVIPSFVQLSGYTTDSNGVPVPNVHISSSADITVNGLNSRAQINTTSDENGWYSTYTIPYSNYDERITPPNGSGFIETSINGLDLSQSISQNIILSYSDSVVPVVTSGPYITSITDTSAVVEWQTDEPSTSEVLIDGRAVSVPGMRTQHNVSVSGLAAETSYSVQASSYDSTGNGPALSEVANFRTLSVSDTTDPTITSGPIIAGITQNRVLVQWVTSEPATTSLTYGATSPVTPISIAGLRESHELEITGLNPSTQYVVQVHATDAVGNGPVSGPVIDFLTVALADTKPPVIVAGPMVTNITDTEVTVEWETDEPSVSGVSSNDGTVYNVYRDENLTTQHKIRITGLTPGTFYNYTVSSTDELNNGPTLSLEKQFTTSAAIDTDSPMVVEPLKIVGITHKSALIHWSTDEPSDGVIEYGISSDVLGSIEIETKLKKKHVLQLVGLDVDTEYFLRARSTDTNGNEVVTDVSSFRTRTHPDTAKPNFTVSPTIIAQTDTAATIYWETDEPTDAVVEYGAGQSKDHRRSNPEKSTKHQATLAGLSANEEYSFSVGCSDASGNHSKHNSQAQVAIAEPSQKEELLALARNWVIKPAIAESSTTGFSTNAEADITAPIITSEPEIVENTSEYILIRWVTDEATNSRVEFGLSGGVLDQVVGDIEYGTEHLMVLPNVIANTSYDFKVYSVDVAGNSVFSDIQTIVSGSQANMQSPAFNLAPSVNMVSDTEVIAIWGTDEYATGSLVCVMDGGSSTWQAGVEGLRKDHTLHLNGLVAGSAYGCHVTSEDISGNKVSSDAVAVVATGQVPDPVSNNDNNDPVPVDNITADSSVNNITTDLNANSSGGGGGSLHPLYLLFMMIYFAVFSGYLRKHHR